MTFPFQEPSGEGLRRVQEAISDFERLTSLSMQSFRVIDIDMGGAQSQAIEIRLEGTDALNALQRFHERLERAGLLPDRAEALEERRQERSRLATPSCRYSAHSQLLRCAVNPCGPCEGCTHYEPLQPQAKFREP